MASELTAQNVIIKVNGKTFGCAQSASLSTKVEMTDAVCAATAGFKKQIPGMESWDGSFTAIVRVFDSPTEEATNVTLREMYTTLREKSLVELEYEIGGLDGYVFTSQAYLSNVDISIPEGSGLVTWSANLVGAEPLLLA